MKLLLCLACGDIVRLRREPRRCSCGASSGHYLEDDSTVELTPGAIAIAFLNPELRDAIAAWRADPSAWHPYLMFRAYLNPTCEPDIKYVPEGESTS